VSRRDSALMALYGLIAAVAGGVLTYGEMNWWDSAISFVPGILLYPIVAAIGVWLFFWGLFGLVRGR